MIIYYLFTHKTGFTAISVHVLVQLILCVWRNDWLTSEWMRVTFLLLCFYCCCCCCYSSSVWHFGQNILRKIPALYRYNFNLFFVNVNNNITGAGAFTYSHKLLKRSTLKTKQNKWMEIEFFMLSMIFWYEKREKLIDSLYNSIRIFVQNGDFVNVNKMSLE